MEGQAGVYHGYKMLLFAQFCQRVSTKYSDSHCISMLVDEAISAQDLLLPQGAAESRCDRQHTTRRDEELQWGGGF